MSDPEAVDAEGFTAAERAESLARADLVFGTLPTAEQVERSKATARGWCGVAGEADATTSRERSSQ